MKTGTLITEINSALLTAQEYFLGATDVDNGESNCEGLISLEMDNAVAKMAILENRIQETEKLLLQTTQNLGHPAYGLSISTTFAIDELRETSFDFMGVPKEVQP